MTGVHWNIKRSQHGPCLQGAHNLVKGQIHKSLSYNVNYLSRRFHLYVESKKNYIKEFIYKTEIDSQTQKIS